MGRWRGGAERLTAQGRGQRALSRLCAALCNSVQLCAGKRSALSQLCTGKRSALCNSAQGTLYRGQLWTLDSSATVQHLSCARETQGRGHL